MRVQRMAALAVLVVAVVVGLLGMHTLAGGHADHHPAAASSAWHADAHTSAPEPCDSCADDGAGQHAMAVTCVLALLFLVAVLRMPSRPLWFVLPRAALWPSAPRGTAGRAATAPSLIHLGISRT